MLETIPFGMDVNHLKQYIDHMQKGKRLKTKVFILWKFKVQAKGFENQKKHELSQMYKVENPAVLKKSKK